METFIFVLHVISCLFLIGLILIQKGQGSDIGAAFGGASQTVFGSRGPATFLNKLTIIVAVVFLSASIYLAHTAKSRIGTSVVDDARGIEAPAATEEARPEATTTPEEGAIKPEAAPAPTEKVKDTE